jgi:hypothetical protein
MDPDGLTNSVINAVALITRGRVSLRTEGKAEEGREDFHKGILDAIEIFKEAISTNDIFFMLLCENVFLAQELEGADAREKKARESYGTALIEYDDAFACYDAIQKPDKYKEIDACISHSKEYRKKGMPKDGFIVAVMAHPARLENGMKMIGLDPDEQMLRELRIKACKQLKDLYFEKQLAVLGNSLGSMS